MATAATNQPFENQADGDEYSSIDESDSQVRSLKTVMMPNLIPFRNLTGLSILNIHYKLDRWEKQLLAVLGNSPGLHNLGLSVSADTIEHIDRNQIPFGLHYNQFLSTLCRDYHDRKLPPLRLRSLYLGHGIQLDAPDFLGLLIDLLVLEEVYHFNGHLWHLYGDCIDTSEWPDIAWDTFSVKTSPKLRQISFESYKPYFHRWLSETDKNWVGQLILKYDDWSDGDFGAMGTQVVDLLDKGVQPRMIRVGLSGRVPRLDPERDFSNIAKCEALQGLSIYILMQPEYLDLLIKTVGASRSITQLQIEYHGLMPHSYGDREDFALTLAEASTSLRYIGYAGRSCTWRVLRTGVRAALELLDDEELQGIELFRRTSPSEYYTR